MEDDLKKNKNGRQPQKRTKMEEDLIFLKLEWRPKRKGKWPQKNEMEDNLIKKMIDNLQIKGKTTPQKMEDDLTKMEDDLKKWKKT